MLLIKESVVDTVRMVLWNRQWSVKENILRPGGIAMKSSWKAVFGGVAAVLCLSSPAAAEEWIILGTRALGMGVQE